MTESVTRSIACLNCGAPLTGPFCAECGQRDIPPYPSTRELVVDAFWELSGWDGRFAATVRALVQRPGMLTREFLEGRRARFLSPLRLYLLASLAYFVIAAATPDVRLPGKNTNGLTVSATAKSRPERVADAVSGSLDKSQVLTSADREAALKDIERAPALIRPFLHKAVADPTGFKRGIVEAMPRMLFALLPIFAAIVAVFYRRRKYPEHLYFAIHLHAFMFLALSVAALSKFTRVPTIVEAFTLVSVLWIPVYATLSFRRVYGGSIAMTLVKEVAIGTIYFAVSVIAFILTLYWVSVAG
ncbi:MAG: hypothetical protein JWL61_1519 [Gemmatimonadetes bacterium]|nr:hypothetical protein [Gemmatimonadota bacterium]